MSFEEILDIVSVDDKVIRQEKKSIIYAQNLSSFRVINGFICNSQKKLWIPRRHPNKKLFPLHLDASVGGHVISGETYHEAFERETKEELGLSISKVFYKPIMRLTPHEHNTSAFMWVYLIETNDVPSYNTNDFVDFYWLSPDDVFQKLKEGDCAKSDLTPILHAIKDKL